MRRPTCNRRLSFLTAVVFSLLLLPASALAADTPLHQRIDQLIAAGTPDYDKIASPIATDAEFLRRIYLDLTGTIPTVAEARAFLADTATDKRAKLIDRLLASPEHARHLAQVFDVLLMQRRPDKHVTKAQWQEYLRTSFAENKSWDQLVREMLSADGSDDKLRPAAKFYLDRDGEPNQVTRDVSQLFLGMNLQCAQCHDHPIIDDYKQDDYYGVLAFFNRSFVFNDVKVKKTVIAEKAEGETSFQNVFDQNKVTRSTGPRLPGGALIKEPTFEKGKEYEVAPAKDVRPVPKFSRRAQLADQLATADNAQFSRASANRFWALLLGRGLIHPLDQDHRGNAPSHPELLDLLAKEFAALKFDIRAFLRELALSQTYQRSSELRDGVKEVDADVFAMSPLKALSPEQLALAVMQATGFADAERQALGKNLTEAALYAKLTPGIAPFVAIFAGPVGQPEEGFLATLEQTLFLTNGKLIRGWLTPRAGNLLDRLSAQKDGNAVAEELYLSMLARMPSTEERKEIADHLKGRSDRQAALQELAWALLASAEFRFNH